MPFHQSIDSARKERIGTHGVDAAALSDALTRTAGALDWLRARHADGALPLLRLPERHDDLARHPQPPARGSRAARPTSSFSAPADRASAARRSRSLPDYAVAGARRVPRRAAPAFHGQSRSRHLRGAARAAAARDHALRRDLEIRRHRRDPDADHRGARGGEGGRARRAHPRPVPRPHRAGQGRQAQRAARRLRRIQDRDARARYRRRRTLLGAHQCRPAARRRARPRHRRDPRRRRRGARAGAREARAGRRARRRRRRAVGRAAEASRSR